MPITRSQPICSGGLAVKYLRPLPCALALILALSSLSLAATQTEFAGAVSYVTGSFPIFVTTADLNKDGKMDIIAANNATNNISVLLGNGDGTFQAKIDTPANLAPKSIAVVDFDKDGRLDLVIANAGNEGIVTVLPGRGDGTFKTPVPVTLGGNEISVAAADLNGDGNADIAAIDNSGTGTLWIVLGNGNMTFQTPVAYTTNVSAPTYVALGDLNGDLKNDVVVGNSGTESVAVFLNNGDGTLGTSVTYSTGAFTGPTSVALGDVNLDGKLDLVASVNGHIASLLGNGDGTFQGALFSPVVINGILTLSDLNKDGWLDVAIPNSQTSVLNVMLGNGNGIFVAPQGYSTAAGPTNVAAADFNGDGFPDLVTADFTSVPAETSVLLNAGSSLALTISPVSLKYASQTVGTLSAKQSTKLTNTGAVAITISNVSIAGDFQFTNKCGTTLSPGASCNINVSFQPTAVGTRLGTLTITDTAPGSPHKVSLRGNGM